MSQKIDFDLRLLKLHSSFVTDDSTMKNLKILTFSDKPLNDHNWLVKTCRENNLCLEIITPPSEWKVNAQKIKLLYDYLNKLNEDVNLLVVDAFDVHINANATEILSKFDSFQKDIVFSAESNFYFRNPELRQAYLKQYPKSPTIYRYLNSGTFIGKSNALKQFLEEIIISNDLDPNDLNSFIAVRSDQYLYAKHFVDASQKENKKYSIGLDYYHQLFEVTGGRMRVTNLPYISTLHAFNAYKIERFLIKLLNLNKYQDLLTDIRYDNSNHKFYNRVTKSTPLMIHIPGSWKFFDRLINQLITGKKPFSLLYLVAGFLSIIAYLVSLLIPTKINI